MRKKCVVKEAEAEDLDYVVENLREEDRKEISAFIDSDAVEEAIRESFRLSDMKWCLRFKDVPAVLAGVVAGAAKIGRPWLVATKDLTFRVPVRRHLALISHGYLEQILEKFDFLYNWVSFENAYTVSWLSWLGFFLSPEYSITRNGVQFLYAYYVKERA